jgi:IclR family acetate operon transcriptional repressor
VAKRANPENYNLESVARMAAVLRSLEASEGSSLDQVARLSCLSESTALRYLSSLATHDLVERDPATGTYRLGLSLFRLGTAAIRQRDIVAQAGPVLIGLRDRFEETVNLAARQGNQVILIQTLESPRSLRKGVSPGGTDSWHATAVGKALLASIPTEECEAILDSIALPRYTPNTLADRDALTRDLAAIRNRGYAIDDEESIEGLRCVGVAIRDHSGETGHAMSVSGPKSRMAFARLHEIGEELTQATRQLSTTLGYVA